VRDIRRDAEQYTPAKPKPAVPDIDEYAEYFAGQVSDLFRPGTKFADRIAELLKHKSYINPKQQKKLRRVFEGLRKRCDSIIDKLDAPTVGAKVHLLENKE
jgi:hypothetical protein